MQRGERLRSFRGLTVTHGEGAGKQIRAFSRPRELLDQAFRRGVRDAALAGPLVQPRSAAIIARSFAHARVAFEYALAFLEQKRLKSPIPSRTRRKPHLRALISAQRAVA